MDTYVEPKLRTVQLRAALAAGAAALAGAFGVGFAVAQVVDRPVPVTAAGPGHAFSDALTESFALKQ